MPAELFTGFLRLAMLQFLLGSVGVQWARFRIGTTRSPGRALLRAMPIGLLPALVVFGFWAPRAWPVAGWTCLVALEILCALVLLELGLAALAWRVAGAQPRSATSRPALRAGVLALGWGYALTLAWRVPGGPGETLFSITAIAVCLGFLGLGVGRPRASP